MKITNKKFSVSKLPLFKHIQNTKAEQIYKQTENVKTGLLISLLILNTFAFGQYDNLIKPTDVCQKEITTGNYQSALNVCTLQWPLISSKEDPFATMDFYIMMIDIHYNLENIDEQNSYVNKLYEQPSFQKSTKHQYELSRRQGRQFMRTGNYNEAIKFFNNGLQLALRQENLMWISKSYNDVGTIERLLNNYQKAISYYQSSLNAKQRLGNLYMVATTQRNIGIVYTHLEEYKQAVYFYLQALESYQQYAQTENFDHRVHIDIIHIYQDIALTYRSLDDNHNMQKFKQMIIDNFQNVTSARAQSMALMNIAKLDIGEGAYQIAENRLLQAKNTTNQSNYEHTPEIYYQLAYVYHLMQKNELSIEYGTQGLEKLQQVKDNDINMRLHQLLSQVYLNIDKDLAIKYLQKYQAIREQLLKNKYDKTVKAKQYTLELMHKEKNLSKEKYTNLIKSNEIINLQKNMMALIFLLLIAVIIALFIQYRRKKEQQFLTNSIKSHQQQLLLLNKKQQPSNAAYDLDFKKLLVETMNTVLQAWEKHTQSSRIDLAQKSGAWTVSIDNGTLRTRSFDKYLNLKTLPKYPRWKNVVKTCHFILSDETLATDERSKINKRLDNIMHYINEKSLRL